MTTPVKVYKLGEMRAPADLESSQIANTINAPFSFPSSVPEEFGTDTYDWLCITSTDKMVLFSEDDNVFADEGLVHYVQRSYANFNLDANTTRAIDTAGVGKAAVKALAVIAKSSS